MTEWSPISVEEEEEAIDEDMEEEPFQLNEIPEMNQSTPKKAKKAKIHLVETKVKRSNRLRIRNKGFKTNSYGKVNCLGCATKPPTISTSMIRNLGAELCQIDPDELTDEILLRKREVKPIGSKLKDGKGKKNKKDDDKNDSKRK